MKSTLNKISLILAALFLSFANAHCQEENLDNRVCPTPLYNPESTNNLLFDFITQSTTLQLFKTTNTESTELPEEPFPFSNLSLALQKKLSELTAKETAFDKADASLVQELKTQLMNLRAATTKEKLKQYLRTIFELRCNDIQCQNTLDNLSLIVTQDYEAERLDKAVQYVQEREEEALLNTIYEKPLADYYNFCEKHYYILTRLQEIANDGFVIEDAQNQRREIKTLSELMEDTQIKNMELYPEAFYELIYLEYLNFLDQKAHSEKEYAKRKEAAATQVFKDIKAAVKEGYNEVKPIAKQIYKEAKPHAKKAQKVVKKTLKKIEKKLKKLFK